jgi:hypothetical protein
MTNSRGSDNGCRWGWMRLTGYVSFGLTFRPRFIALETAASNKKYQIYVSSAFRDLVDERQDVLKAILGKLSARNAENSVIRCQRLFRYVAQVGGPDPRFDELRLAPAVFEGPQKHWHRK